MTQLHPEAHQLYETFFTKLRATVPADSTDSIALSLLLDGYLSDYELSSPVIRTGVSALLEDFPDLKEQINQLLPLDLIRREEMGCECCDEEYDDYESDLYDDDDYESDYDEDDDYEEEDVIVSSRPMSNNYQYLQWEILDDVARTTTPEINAEFRELLREFQTKEIGGYQLAEEVQELLAPWPELVHGFRQFFPAWYLEYEKEEAEKEEEARNEDEERERESKEWWFASTSTYSVSCSQPMVVQNASATPHFPSTRPPFPSLLPLSQFFQNAPAPPQLGSPIDHQDSSIHHQYPALPQIPEIPLKHYTIKDVLEEVISVDVNLINGIKAAIPRETFITFMVLLSRFRNTELDVHELDSAITSLLAPWPTSLVTPGPELVRAIRQFIPEWYKQCIMMQTEVSRESATEKLERLREDYLAIERLKWELKDIDRRESEMEREYEETEESVKRLQMRKMELEKMAMDMVRKYRR